MREKGGVEEGVVMEVGTVSSPAGTRRTGPISPTCRREGLRSSIVTRVDRWIEWVVHIRGTGSATVSPPLPPSWVTSSFARVHVPVSTCV